MVDYGHVCIVYTRILGPYRFQGPLFDTENIIGCRTPAVDRHFGKLPNNSIGYKMSHRVMYIRFMGACCLIHVVNILLGPTDLGGLFIEASSSTKPGGFDWK